MLLTSRRIVLYSLSILVFWIQYIDSANNNSNTEDDDDRFLPQKLRCVFMSFSWSLIGILLIQFGQSFGFSWGWEIDTEVASWHHNHIAIFRFIRESSYCRNQKKNPKQTNKIKKTPPKENKKQKTKKMKERKSILCGQLLCPDPAHISWSQFKQRDSQAMEETWAIVLPLLGGE